MNEGPSCHLVLFSTFYFLCMFVFPLGRSISSQLGRPLQCSWMGLNFTSHSHNSSPSTCICSNGKMYFNKFLMVFVKISTCICSTWQMYLSISSQVGRHLQYVAEWVSILLFRFLTFLFLAFFWRWHLLSFAALQVCLFVRTNIKKPVKGSDSWGFTWFLKCLCFFQDGEDLNQIDLNKETLNRDWQPTRV